jgi:choline dehydrogenase-like flavoprotein
MAPGKVAPPFAGPRFETKLMQENAVRFGPAYAPELNSARHVTVYLYANAVHLDGGQAGTEIESLSVKTLSGQQFKVRARIYVLAAGGLENARLLLASGESGGNGLGNPHDLVGRFLMVHLAYSAGTIVLADPHMDFDFMTSGPYSPDTYRLHPFVGLTGQAMRERHLPSIMIGWVFQFSPVVGTVDALKRLTSRDGPKGSTLTDLSKVIGDLEGVASFTVRKMLFGQGIPIEALQLWGASEQQPNPLSRVMLGSKRDQLGLPEIAVDWRLTDEDRSAAATTIRLLGTEIGRAGFGRLRSSFGEDDASPKDFEGNAHHMGTTRMHRDPAQGVVDENCRVHTVANLYAAGSSVFPTGGASNPTLTIVALALRLADHLRKQFA